MTSQNNNSNTITPTLTTYNTDIRNTFLGSSFNGYVVWTVTSNTGTNNVVCMAWDRTAGTSQATRTAKQASLYSVYSGGKTGTTTLYSTSYNWVSQIVVQTSQACTVKGTFNAYAYTGSLKGGTKQGGLVSTIKGLGEQIQITLFGENSGDFYLGQETNGVTTGNITLGNAVGFIQIGKYKIPYYT